MEVQEILKYIDELLFSQTGKHLDSLQIAILKGVFNAQKYAEIAKDYHCSTGHVKDEAYELWRILSDTLGEDFNKSNFRATIERLGVANSQYHIIGNPVQVGNINLCSNSSSAEDLYLDKNCEQVDNQTTVVEAAQKTAKLEIVPKLVKLGLSTEQIAQALDLSIDEVKQAIN